MQALLVTIHDVTPALAGPVQRLWHMCVERGCVPGLLVVPDWHGEWPIERHPDFMTWVRARAADGAEIFLHGERHDEVGLPRTWRDELRAAGRTNREGEFLTLGYDAARERIERGLVRLRALDLDPIGFVPPAWLARAETHVAVRDAGLAVSEDDGRVFAHRSGATYRSPVLRWSGRCALRAYGSALQARVRWLAQRKTAVMRIALHPADLDHPVTAASLRTGLHTWLAARGASTYQRLDAQSGTV